MENWSRGFPLKLGLASIVWAALPALSQSLPSRLPADEYWVTDGAVFALHDQGTTLYIGGNFNVVAPPTGSFGVIDPAGSALPQTAKVDGGEVLAVVSDGAGGWFIGGSFTSVGSLPRAGLARVLADGRVASWNPSVSGTVRALVRAGATLYVGGSFGQVGAYPRNNLAAVDMTSGAALSFDPDVDGTVRALALHGSVLYAGGDFHFVNGSTPRTLAAAFQAVGGANPGLATGWDTGLDCVGPATPCFLSGARVNALVATAGDIYVGGLFDRANGATPRNNLAAFDPTSGTVRGPWDPGPGDEVLALALDGGHLYAGGGFGGFLAAFDAATTSGGGSLGWVPNPDRWVSALAIGDGQLYVGGNYSQMLGSARYRLARFDLASFPPTLVPAWEPRPTGTVRAIAVGAGSVAAGGEFAGIGGQERLLAAALDVVTGSLLTWNPVVTGGGLPRVYSIQSQGGLVYLGGNFDLVGGSPRRALAAVDATTGALAAGWVPPALSPADEVRGVSHDGVGKLFVGGSVGAIPGCGGCANLFRVDAASGSMTPADVSWSQAVDTDARVLVVNGTTAVVDVGGDFTTVHGLPRGHAARLDPATGAPSTLDPNVAGAGTPAVWDLEPLAGDLYVAGDFSTVAGSPRPNAAAVRDVPPATATAWDPRPDGPVYALSRGPAGSGWLYVGGSFGGLQETSVPLLGLVRDDNGVPVADGWGPWAPSPDASVSALARGFSRTAAGGAFVKVGGRLRSGVASFCENGTAPSDLSAAGTLGNTIQLTWTAMSGSFYRVYRSTSPTGPWLKLIQLAGPTPAGTFTYDDYSAESSTSYYYQVRLEQGAPGPCLSDPSNTAGPASTGGVCGLPPTFDGISLAEWRDVGGSEVPCSVHLEWAPATPSCGATSVSYSIYRSTDPGFVPDAGNRIKTGFPSTSFDDREDVSGASPAGTTFYYAVRATNPYDLEEDQNLIRAGALVPSGCNGRKTAPARLPVASVRSRTDAASSNEVTWLLPPTGGSDPEFCTRLCDGAFLASPCGTPGLQEVCGSPANSRGSFTHAGLVAGDNRGYSLFRIFRPGAPEESSSGGPYPSGRPDVSPADEAWAYSTGASALVVPALYPGAAYATVSNDRRVHAMTTGATGGLWPAAWAPPAMNAPAASGPAFLPATGALAGKKALIVGGTDGRVYAFDADTGAQLWVRDLATPSVVARPSAMFGEAGGVGDWVFVGTRDSVGPNRMHVLSLSNGSPTGDTFPTSAQGTGVIHAPVLVDYPGQRVFIGSRRLAGGNGDSLFCMSLAAATRGQPCSGWPADDGGVDVGADIDTAMSLRNGRLFFATVAGALASVDATTGTDLDSFALGAAAKGIWTYDAGGGETRILVSTGTALVHLRRPSAGPFGGVSGWSPVSGASFGGFSAPLLASNGKIYLGTGFGQLAAFQLADGSPAGAVTLGDGTATIGSPTRDVSANLLVVGASSGVIYAVPVF